MGLNTDRSAVRLPWLDFHTHQPSLPNQGYIAVRSFSRALPNNTPPLGPFSVGLHPWASAEPGAKQWAETELPRLLQSPNCLALGEVGLDRLQGASLQEQQALLELQLLLAKKLQLPIVVHCVRAWSELLASFRRIDPHTPKAIHGFRGSSQLLHTLLDLGWYISPHVTTHGTIAPIAAQIPAERLLLETDSTALNAQCVIASAAQLRAEPIDELTHAVDFNIRAFYSVINS